MKRKDKNFHSKIYNYIFTKHKVMFAATLVIVALLSILMAVSSYFIAPIMDYLLNSGTQEYWINITTIIIISTAIVVLSLIKRIVVNWLIKLFNKSIRNDILLNLTKNNLYSWDLLNNGEKIALFNVTIDDIIENSYQPIIKLFAIVIETISSIVVITILMPIALAIVIPVAILAVIINLLTMKYQAKVGQMTYTINQLEASNIDETFNNLEYIKQLEATEKWADNFNNKELKIQDKKIKQSKLIAVLISANSSIANIGQALVMSEIILITSLTSYGRAAAIVPMVMLSRSIFGSLLEVVSNIADLVKAKTLKDKTFEKLKLYDFNELEKTKFEQISIIFQEFLLKNTNLKELEINIKHGEKILIEGDNGIGKSFLLKSISGNTNPDLFKQKNNVDGQKFEHLFPMVRLFNYVSNVNYFFDGTVLQNLVFDNTELESKAQELMKHFGLNNINLAQNINQDNVEFSEGEKQRLSLIRAILNPKPIIILDEALVNLDNENKTKVLDYFLNSNQTLIVVNHNIGPELRGLFTQQLQLEKKEVNNA